MKYELWGKRIQQKETNYFELYGLSKSGKTTLNVYLKKQNYRTISVLKKDKIYYLFCGIVRNPIQAILYLFNGHKNFALNGVTCTMNVLGTLRGWILMHSYCCAVIAKRGYISTIEKPFFIDEYYLQSSFMQNQDVVQPTKQSSFLNGLIFPNYICIVSCAPLERKKRLARIGYPGESIHRTYAKEWMNNNESNHLFMLDYIKEHYNKIGAHKSKVGFNKILYPYYKQ
jgi:hypothetical protein